MRLTTPVFVLSFLLAAPAGAVPLTFDFSGRVQSVHSDLASAFAAGDAFSGAFTVDDVATSTSPTTAGSISSYAISAFSVTFSSSYAATSNVGGILVEDNLDFGNPAADQEDRYVLAINAGTYSSGANVNGFAIGNFVLEFRERHAPPVSALTSSSLPLDPDSLFSLGLQNLQFEGFRNVQLGQTNIVFRGVATAVPEPGTLLLLGAGLLGLATSRLRRVHR